MNGGGAGRRSGEDVGWCRPPAGAGVLLSVQFSEAPGEAITAMSCPYFRRGVFNAVTLLLVGRGEAPAGVAGEQRQVVGAVDDVLADGA